MRRYATMPELDIWYDSTHDDSNLIGYFNAGRPWQVSIHIEKKRKKRRTGQGTSPSSPRWRTEGVPRITEDPPIRVTINDDEQDYLVDHLLAEYRMTLQEDRRSLFDRFTAVDVVRRVVGVGSVGVQVYTGAAGGPDRRRSIVLAGQAGWTSQAYEAYTQSSRHGGPGSG